MSRKDTQRQVDAIRSRSSELENHLIDEYRSGYISRRDFVRRGGVIGMSIPVVGFLAAACGTGSNTSTSSGGSADTAVKAGGKEVAVKPGGTLKLGMSPGPTTEIDPIKVADEGGLGVMSQSGEFLSWSDSKLQLQPRLAESWKPNSDGSVWTFKIRQGVKFHDGTPMTADDVASSINALSDPKNGSNALSTFAGVLSKGSAKATDASTVEFQLDGPNGNFPYLLSSDNYNSLIVPKNLSGSWEKTFPGTGPWKMEKYTANSGVSYVPNKDYWDKTRIPKLDRQEVKFYPKEQAQILGLQSGDVDVLIHFSPTGGKAILNDPNITVIELRASVHREIHMRNDKKPFDDKRVRQAMALAVDRAALVNGLMAGKSDFGNDSPFAPGVPVDRQERPAAQAGHREGQGAAAAGGRLERVGHDRHLGRLRAPRPRPAPAERRRQDRAQADPERDAGGHVLRRRRLRQVAVARLDDGHHRLRPPRRAERVPRGAAVERRRVERGALQEQRRTTG